MAKKGISTPLSVFQQELMRSVLGPDAVPAPASPRRVSVAFADPFANGTTGRVLTREEVQSHDREMAAASPLIKSVLNVLNGPGDTIERLAFTTNPAVSNNYQSLWRRKLRLLPDEILKRIGVQDDLVAAILNTRSNQVSAFGRPQPDRFSTGFKIEPEPGHTEKMPAEEKKKLQDRIAAAEARLLTCGQTRGYADHEALGLGQYLFMSARNACLFGRTATEAIYNEGMDGRRHFHSFRPIDAGTIFRATPYKQAAQVVRDSALKMLEDFRGKKLVPERYIDDEYAWIQVIDGRPMQAFTADECLVHNFYPTTDVELDGYPITPMDTVIAAVTTHINITTHNKLYFQNGRAARGMVVIKSDDIDDTIVGQIRQQFNANINSVGNSFRMPIFGVGTDDDIGWYPIDNSSRDMEFQYLSDTNARVILSAYQMSPEELPGYAHLSRGTNSQALSESNGEFKLEAARDVGIRPLLAHFQNHINAAILPLIDEELSKFCHFKFVGLDADTAEKESVRLQQDMAVHMTMDELLERVEKQPVGKRMGGRFHLNPQWQAVLDKMVPVGVQMEHFLGVENASKDPRFQYLRDPFFFNWQQLLMQQQQMQQQQMQQQQQQMQAQAQQQQQQPQEQAQGQDLTRSVDQLAGLLSKGEQQLSIDKRQLLVHQRRIVASALQGLTEDARKATEDILKTADDLLPVKLKD